jgi:hypothetical protein
VKVIYDGQDYEFSLDEIDVSQATLIYRKYSLTLLGLETGLREGNPDALRAIYWLMLTQAGQKVNIDNVSFKIVKFANAIQAAVESQAEADAEKPDTPKEEPEA